MKGLLIGVLALLPNASLAAATTAAGQPVVVVAAFSGVISPASAEYLVSAVDEAGRRGAAALVIELDTPGGLDLAMREAVKAILSSRVPVIVYVSPPGARAASAGVFLTMAAHVAAMAPGTNIGAAHPVQLGGGLPSSKEKDKPDAALESKLANDASAYLAAIAARRGRNAAWAAEAVSKSSSTTSSEAVRLRVVDLEAESLEKLLEAVDGKVLADFPGAPLRVKGAALERFPMSPRQRLLAAVSDPNIAMVLMTLGVSGLLIELYNPGLILPGIVGAVSLILAFYSFQTLSASFAGVLLILAGLVLYILELKIVSYGLLALGGTAAVLFGGLMLFRDAPGVKLDLTVLLGAVGTIVALFAALAWVSARALRRVSPVGAAAMVGQGGEAVTALAPRGTVLVAGELWRAESVAGPIAAGAAVVVEAVAGLSLKVRPR